MDLLDEIKILREETAWREEGARDDGQRVQQGMHDLEPYIDHVPATQTKQRGKKRRTRQEGRVTNHTSSALVDVVGVVSLPSSSLIIAAACPIASASSAS